MKTLTLVAIVFCASIASAQTVGFYDFQLGQNKDQIAGSCKRASIHYLNQAEHLKVLHQNKLASIILEYKDVCAESPKDLDKGFKLINCSFTSDRAKSKRVKSIALVMAGEKLVRIEVELDAKENKNNPELDNLIQSGTQRSDTEKFNGIAKINGLYSLAPFLKELGNESKQKIFQKGEQFFATNTAKDSLYLVLLDLGTLVQHQQKN